MTVAFARVPAAAGHILLSRCPGRDGPLAAWVEAAAAAGAGIALSLTEEHELVQAGASGLGPMLAARGITWHHIPIPDFGVPDDAWRERFQILSPVVERSLCAGGTVLIHCFGGLGRSGLVAAHLLTRLGQTASEAIAHVRAARPGAVETASQETWIANAALDRRA